jgi:hypothetical protein
MYVLHAAQEIKLGLVVQCIGLCSNDVRPKERIKKNRQRSKEICTNLKKVVQNLGSEYQGTGKTGRKVLKVMVEVRE